MAQKIVNGARCKAYLTKPGESPKLVGIFNRLSYSVALDAQVAFILGRATAAAIEYTGAEPVNISATGWRVVGAGAHSVGGVPKIQDLLTSDYLTFDVLDRVTGEIIAHITNVRATGYSGDFANKQLTEMPLSYIGILASDEDGPQGEPSDAAALP